MTITKAGSIILYPTDTVYGLGVDATDAEAVRALKALKGRPSFAKASEGKDDQKPISIMVADMAMAERYAEVTPLARTLAKKFLPGKLTIVLTAKNLPDEITAGTGTVGIRIPAHEAALALVRERGVPLTATSANVSGMPTMGTVPEILAQFGSRAGMIYHTGPAEVVPPSPPSTVVDARGEVPIVIREGAIAKLAIFEALR